MSITLICSITGFGPKQLDRVLPFAANDEERTSAVKTLYERAGMQYPKEFTCFIATRDAPKRDWIGAFGAKRQPSVKRIIPIEIDQSSEQISLDVSSVFETGLVIVAKTDVIDELEVAAKGDISDVACRSSGHLIPLEGKSRGDRETLLSMLADEAYPEYCEVRLRRALMLDDIEKVFSLSEYLDYTKP